MTKTRLWIGGIGAVLLSAAFGGGIARAQDSNAAAPVIGPPQLQNFQLQPQQRIVTQPPPAATQPVTVAPPRPAATQPAAQSATPPAAGNQVRPAPPPAARQVPPAARPAAPGQRPPAAQPQFPTAAPDAGPPVQAPPPAAGAPPSATGPQPPAAQPAPESPLISTPAEPPPRPEPTSIWDAWPYAAGGALLALIAVLVIRSRRRSREIAAAVAEATAEAALRAAAPPTRPTPRPPGQPAAQPASPPPSPALLQPRAAAAGPESKSAARPWLELALRAERASFTSAEASVQFELDVSNAGAIAARNVRIDVKIINAGAEQDQEIGAFFGTAGRETARLNLPGVEAGVSGIIRGEVGIAVEQMKAIRLDERLLYIPVIAVNALYDWSDAESGRTFTGQTSKSYVVGRELQEASEKMGAFRVDQGPRVWRTVGQRPHKLARRV